MSLFQRSQAAVVCCLLSISACKDLGTDELLDDLGLLFSLNSIQLDLANSNIPTLMRYERLFTAPTHGTADAALTTVGGTAGTLQAGAARLSLLDASYLGNFVGDMPLAGFNRKAVLATNVIGEVAAPGQQPHHHFFKRSDGKFDDIYSRALVLSDGTAKVVIIVVDMVAIPNDVFDKVYADLVTAGIVSDRSQLMIAATHTHSGPGAFVTKPLWKLVSGDVFVPDVFTGLVNGIVQSVKNANTGLTNAQLDIASGTGPDVVKNRRAAFYAAGAAPLNKTITVMHVRKTTAGNPVIATLFNFAIHGTCVSAVNTLYSGDCLGNAMTKVEAKYSGSVSLFLNGAEADVKPDSLLSFFQVAAMDDIGTKIANSVETIVSTMSSYQTTVRLRGASRYVTLPTPEVKYGPMLGDFGTLGLTLNDSIETTAYFNALDVRAGTKELLITAVPGEAATDVGNSIIAAGEGQMDLTTKFSMIAGLTNGHMGYIVTPAQYDLGGYEAAATFHGRTTATFLEQRTTEVQTAVAQ